MTGASMILSFAVFFGLVIAAVSAAGILGFVQYFDSKGPLIITLFGSVILAVNLTGVRFSNGNYEHYDRTLEKQLLGLTATYWGRLTFNHSHHSMKQREGGHEFKFRGRFFCTGCYGIFIGTVIAIASMIIYLTVGISPDNAIFYIIAMVFCFVPIISRYTVFTSMKTEMRLLSNILLPVGCSLYLIVFDYFLQNWFLNVGLVLLTLLIATLRGIVANNDNTIKL
ncbi:MAG: hypothetical protein ACFFD4_26165 [Candidatus Odinarchaeota archaeon]